MFLGCIWVFIPYIFWLVLCREFFPSLPLLLSVINNKPLHCKCQNVCVCVCECINIAGEHKFLLCPGWNAFLDPVTGAPGPVTIFNATTDRIPPKYLVVILVHIPWCTPNDPFHAEMRGAQRGWFFWHSKISKTYSPCSEVVSLLLPNIVTYW